MILSNLEYAKNPDVEPLEERTFARNYRPTMVSTIEFIRERELNDLQVSEINFILKATAQRHIAAGREEWLYPERTVTRSWRDLRDTLQPPTDELYRFGGEMYARYESGHVHYQDEFGRTEKPRPFLQKRLPASPLKHNEPCGCGSGSPFRLCCSAKPTELRPTWTEKSIRERNMMLFGALINLLELDKKDWKQVRRDLTDEKIAKAYRLYEGLWPLDTDLLKLLPKPDGQLRSVFTGSLHPSHVHEFALSSGLYFGEILMQHPFINSATLNKQYRPTENPRQYRGEFLKAMVLFMDVMPLVEAGLVNLIPDPCDFDFHLREQMMALARARAAGFKFDLRDDPRMEELMREEYTRTLLALPDDSLRRQIARRAPKEDRLDIEELMPAAAQLREGDPLLSFKRDLWGPAVVGSSK